MAPGELTVGMVLMSGRSLGGLDADGRDIISSAFTSAVETRDSGFGASIAFIGGLFKDHVALAVGAPTMGESEGDICGGRIVVLKLSNRDPYTLDDWIIIRPQLPDSMRLGAILASGMSIRSNGK